MINYRVEYTATDDLISQAINIDRQVYSKSDVGKINACKQWLNVNNEIYTFLLDGNKLVGYINFVHLTDECFELFCKGK